MIVLSIDTAGVDCAACVYDSGTGAVLGAVTETIGKGHAERLMAIVDAALADAKRTLSDIERIAVTIGPGSFTGIRVGVAAARGFALSLGVEAVGITTLATLAEQHRHDHGPRAVWVALDAKRDECYLQSFAADGVPSGKARLLPIAEAKQALSGFQGVVIGSAAPLLAGADTGAGPDHFPIDAVARLAAACATPGEKPAPLYLRGPDARPQTGFALERAPVA